MGVSSSKTMEIPESVKNFVDTLIASKKVVVFSKSYCPYCTNAKKIFEKYPIASDQYEAIEIENREDCSDIQNYLKQLTGASSVPRVFINAQSIGGCDDTTQLESSGQLSKRLEECEALVK